MRIYRLVTAKAELATDFDQRLDQSGLLGRPERDVATASARLVRWVIRRSTGTSPSRIAAMTRSKSSDGGVAASKQGHFLAVEIRIHEGDRVLDDADEHVAAAMGDEVEALLHRLPAARRVEDDIEAVAVGERARPPARVARGRMASHADDRLRCGSALRLAIEDRDIARPTAARTAQRRGRSGRLRRPARCRRSSPRRALPHGRRSPGTLRPRIRRRSGRGADEIAGRHATAARPCRRPGERRAPICSRSNSACRPGRRCNRRRRDRD